MLAHLHRFSRQNATQDKTDSVRSANMQGSEFRDLGFVAWKCFLG